MSQLVELLVLAWAELGFSDLGCSVVFHHHELGTSEVSLLAKDHVETEGVLDALEVVSLHDLHEALHGVGLGDQALGEEFRLLVLAFELLKGKLAATLGVHHVVVEGNHQVLALQSLVFPLGELVAEKVHCSLVAAVQEHGLRSLREFTCREILVFTKDLTALQRL